VLECCKIVVQSICREALLVVHWKYWYISKLGSPRQDLVSFIIWGKPTSFWKHFLCHSFAAYCFSSSLLTPPWVLCRPVQWLWDSQVVPSVLVLYIFSLQHIADLQLNLDMILRHNMTTTKGQERPCRKATNHQPGIGVCQLCYNLSLNGRQKIYKQRYPLSPRSVFYEYRKFKDIKQSAQLGCRFCTLICQASNLLSFLEPDHSDLVFDSDMPTTICLYHGAEAKSKEQLEVQIYPRKPMIY